MLDEEMKRLIETFLVYELVLTFSAVGRWFEEGVEFMNRRLIARVQPRKVAAPETLLTLPAGCIKVPGGVLPNSPARS
jgi:hypothetical protein